MVIFFKGYAYDCRTVWYNKRNSVRIAIQVTQSTAIPVKSWARWATRIVPTLPNILMSKLCHAISAWWTS